MDWVVVRHFKSEGCMFSAGCMFDDLLRHRLVTSSDLLHLWRALSVPLQDFWTGNCNAIGSSK